MSWLGKVFELNPDGLNWPRGVMMLDAMLVPLVVFWAIGYVMLLAGLLATRRTAKAPPQPAKQPA